MYSQIKQCIRKPNGLYVISRQDYPRLQGTPCSIDAFQKINSAFEQKMKVKETQTIAGQRIRDLEEEVKRLLLQVKTPSTQPSQLDNQIFGLRLDIKNKEALINRLYAEVESLKNSRSQEDQATVNQLNTRIGILKEEINKLMTKLQEVKKHRDQLLNELNVARESLGQQVAKVNALENDLMTLKTNLDEAKTKLVEADVKIERLQEMYKAAKKALNTTPKANEMFVLSQEMASLNRELTKAVDSNDKLKAELDEALKKNFALYGEFNTIFDDYEKLQAELKVFKEANPAFDADGKLKEELEKALTDRDNIVKEYEALYQDYEQVFDQLKAYEHLASSNVQKELQAKNQQLQAAIENKQKLLDEYQRLQKLYQDTESKCQQFYVTVDKVLDASVDQPDLLSKYQQCMATGLKVSQDCLELTLKLINPKKIVVSPILSSKSELPSSETPAVDEERIEVPISFRRQTRKPFELPKLSHTFKATKEDEQMFKKDK